MEDLHQRSSFEAVQALRLFKDSKKFPDMIPKGWDLDVKSELDGRLNKFREICEESFLLPVNRFDKKLQERYEGFNLEIVQWGDGSRMPTSGNRLVIVGPDNNNVLHFRIFDADGNRVSDTDEKKEKEKKGLERGLPTQAEVIAGHISALRRKLERYIERQHKPSEADATEIINEVTIIVGQTFSDRFKGMSGLGEGVIEFRSRLNEFIKEHFQSRPEVATLAQSVSREPTSSMEVYIDSVWSVLRRDSDILSKDMFKGTLIELNYPYVVAGGRFDEVYYWDAYFTGEGLVLSGYSDLFECMVRNYATFIKTYGYMPNGNRLYYLSRSQPPFFCSMVDLLVRLNGFKSVEEARIPPIQGDSDKNPIKYIKMVEKEYEFWVGCGLQLMSSLNDVRDIPTEGKNLIIVAAVKNVLHVRIFDGSGKVVVDTDEKRLTEQAQQPDDLREQLKSLWPPHELTRCEKDRVITAITSIVGLTQRLNNRAVIVDLKSIKEGYVLQPIPWGDGSGVPTSGKNLIIVGIDNNSLLHIRIFDASGNLVKDTDETIIPDTRAGAISTLKQQLPGLLPLYVLSCAEKTQVISILDQILKEEVVLNRYWDDFWDESLCPRVQPRPEAYHEDIFEFAHTDKYKPEDAAVFFRQIRATAESGWDFSSRWFRPEPDKRSGIRRGIPTIRTTKVLPVDLNALLFGIEKKLHKWTGNPDYATKAARRKQAILDYFWNDELGWFFDYCREAGEEGRTDVWSLAGAYPLFTELFDSKDEADRAKVGKMVRAIRERFLRAGGVVTTLLETGAQWDYPNGWAPLQWIVVRGLRNYEHLDDEYRKLALEIAKRFVTCVGRTYKREGRIMEKYNVCDLDAIAGGGEYGDSSLISTRNEVTASRFGLES